MLKRVLNTKNIRNTTLVCIIRALCLVVILITANNIVHAQGFDWQKSSRLPFVIPDLYVGVTADYGFSNHFGNFAFIEKYDCLDFKSGEGSAFSLGVAAEYWLDGETAIHFSANYKTNSIDFSETYEVPREKWNAIYKDTYHTDISEFCASAIYKYRLFDGHFYAGGGAELAYLIDEASEFYEEILGPEQEPPFNTNPASYKRSIFNGKINSMNKFQINALVSLGYDWDLGIGWYGQTYINASMPLISRVTSDSWHYLEIKIGAAVLMGQ